MVEEREQSAPLTFQNETETQGEVELPFHRVTQGPGILLFKVVRGPWCPAGDF